MNAAPKIVLSRTLGRAEWKNTRVVSGQVREEVSAVKERARGDCFVFGGARAIASLRQLGLIDEYRLVLHPVVLGAGTPMFVDVAEHFQLLPLRSKRFESGVTMLSYGVAGR